jgi:methionyl-tRNA formyltransferase
MNIIFMGTPEFAACSLRKLVVSQHNVLAVVTQPDRPKGRGMKVISSPVKETALAHHIPCFQPERPKEKEFIDILRDLKPETVVVSAYGHIIPRDILDIPPYGCVNIHSSLLPRYRGAAPMNWAIINGEAETGITIMLMDEKMDTGDILLQRAVSLAPTCTARELYEVLAPIGAELLIEALDGLEKDSITPVKQDDSKATYAPKLKKEDGLINWEKSSKEINNLIRGVNPWPGAFTYINNKLLKIWSAKIEDEKGLRGQPGEITLLSKDKMIVNTGDGSLSFLEVQMEGGKRMFIKDFLQGHPLKAGTVFKSRED